ncbi:MAG: LamG-like jellyroll fold domain-containing protein [Phycisphaeraceae bacterium]
MKRFRHVLFPIRVGHARSGGIMAAVITLLLLLGVGVAHATPTPVAYWNFDEGTGTSAADSAGSVNDAGTLTNGPTWTTGASGGAIQFDGTNDYVIASNSTDLAFSGAMTVAAWAKSDTANWNTYGMLVSRRSQFILHPASGGKVLQFYVYIGGQAKGVAYDLATDSIDLTQWHHYAGTYDGSSLKLYVDGQLKATVSQTGTMDSTTNSAYIGRDSTMARYFDGAIDEVRLYNTALNANDIAQLAGTAGGAETTTILVDLGASTDANDVDSVNTWNVSNYSTSGATLVDASGAATGIALEYSTNVTWGQTSSGSITWFASDYLNDGTTANPDKDPVLALGMGDSVSFNRQSSVSGTYTTAFLTFTGLDANATYSLDIVALNPGTGGITHQIQASDAGVLRWGDSGENRRGGKDYQTKTSGFQPNDHEVMRWTALVPDSNGKIVISYGAGNNFVVTGRLGAIRLTEIAQSGTNWFVRPSGGSYGNEDGTSYADAWDGLENIDWQVILPGDNLYICGTHVRTVTSNTNIASQGWILPGASGTAGNHVKIRGDWPSDPGIVWGAWKDNRPGGMKAANWVANWNGNTGVYYNETAVYNKSNWQHGLFERINGLSYEKYTWVSSVQAVIDSPQGGVFYAENFGTNQNRVWLRPFHTSDFADTIRWSGTCGWRLFLAENQSYVTYRGLTVIASTINHEDGAATAGPYHDYTFLNCKFFPLNAAYWYTPVNSNNITIDGCEIAFTGNGMYVIWSLGSNHHFYVKNSYFHDIGNPWGGGVDGHALGIQNNEHFYFTNNHFERCSSAIDFHVGATTTQRHCYVIGNFIKDMRTGWGAVVQGSAITFEGDNNNPKANTSDLYIANNIVMDCDANGISTSRKSTVKVYNNTVMDCNYNYKFVGNRVDGASVEMFNNISVEPRTYHVYFNQNASGISFYFDAANNLYDDSGSGSSTFYTLVTGYPTGAVDFAAYCVRHDNIVTGGTNTSGATIERDSLVDDPLFVSGTPAVDTDFKLLSNSPAVDAGLDVDLDEDYGGNTRDSSPDIGAWEH